MTLRAKPVVKRPGRSGWNSEERRTFLTNLGFVLAIVLSVVLLVGYAAYSFYDDHFGAAATVDGTTITKDQLVTRYAIEDFRIKYTESRIRTLQAAGRLDEASASQQLQYLDQRRQSLGSIAIERLIDIVLQAKLADELGVSVDEADIDAQLLLEATTEEQRHAWVIEVTPDNDPATGKPGDAETAAAKATAEAALAQLKGGKAWEDVANSASEAATAVQAGDLGWLPEESGYDEPFMAAVFAAAPNQPTEVVAGDDGAFRIGRITEVAPMSVDETFQIRLEDAEVKLADYREAIRGDLIRTGLDEKVVADLSKPSAQRYVQQIFLAINTPQPDGVKVRHILISPKDDPGGAAALPADDPAWKAAEDEARGLYDLIVANPRTFDVLAREKSDEGQATSSGGKLPYYDPTSPIDNDFAKAIFAPGLQPGQLLPPFKSAFGWHIVQVMRPYGDGEVAWLTKLRDQLLTGADFAQVARDQGEGDEAAAGGDIGWVAVGEFGDLKEAPIFTTEVGGLSDVVSIPEEGVYLWKVIGEEVREPTRDQIATFNNSAFTNWYTLKKAEATITRATDASSATQ